MKFIFAFILLSYVSLSEETDSLKQYRLPSLNVSATKAEKGITHVTFSEISSEELDLKRSNTDLPQMLNTMPSVISYSENGNWLGYSNMTLRGFDQRRIAVYINGIPQNDPEDHNLYWINYTDLYESIGSLQIQRGAGVANFGAASIGGAINIETSNFANEPQLRYYTGVGFQEFSGRDEIAFNSTKHTLELSSGLVDEKYSFYGRVSRIRSDGYRQGTWANMYSYFFSGVRYDKNLTTQVNVYGGGQRDGLAYSGISQDLISDPTTRLTNFNLGEVEDFNSPHVELLNDWFINKNMTFKSRLFYFEGKGFFDYSGAGWADELFGIDSSNGFDATYTPRNSQIRGWVGNKQWGWLSTFSWNHKGGNLLVGAEIRFHESGHWGRIQNATELPTDFDFSRQFFSYTSGSDIFSFFVKERIDLTDRLKFTLDLSVMNKTYFLRDEKVWGQYRTYFDASGNSFSANGELFRINYLFLNPRFGLNYKVSDDLSLYFSSAYTNRPPRRGNIYDADFRWAGSNPLFESTTLNNGEVAYDFNSPITDPESMLDIELGSIIKLNEVTLSVNAYWMEFFNELAYNGSLNGYGAPLASNIPRTRHAGIELDANWGTQITNSFRVDGNLNFTLSQNVIVEFEEAGVNYAENEIAGFPSYLMNTFWNFTYKKSNLIIDAKLVDDMRVNNFGDSDDSNLLEGYFVLNAGISHRFENALNFGELALNLNVNNLLNELYTPYGIGTAFFPAAERAFYFGVELSI